MEDAVNSKKLEMITFLLLFLLVSLGFFWLLKPFFASIFWACAIAIVFYPVHERLTARLPARQNLVALLTLALSMVVVILPLFFIISAALGECIDLYKKIESGEIKPEYYLERFHAAFPIFETTLRRVGINLSSLKDSIGPAVLAGSKFIAQNSLSIGQNMFTFLLNLGLVLYLTFFMLRDGSRLIELLRRALPLGDAREELLFSKFAEVTRATVKGNLLVAMAQGFLGGLIFWILGIQGALLWGVFMVVAAMIPLIGPALIWVPVAIYLLSIGELASAAILTFFGVAVIGVVDNILRPLLVGRDTKLPDYLILLSTLGGLALFGMNGFVVGPLIAALFIAFWGIFIREISHSPVSEQEEQDGETLS